MAKSENQKLRKIRHLRDSLNFAAQMACMPAMQAMDLDSRQDFMIYRVSTGQQFWSLRTLGKL